jgi:hypothetical protein
MKNHFYILAIFVLLTIQHGCQTPETRTGNLEGRLAQIKRNPVVFDEGFEIAAPPAALEVVREGNQALKRLLVELKTATDEKYRISLCAILDKAGLAHKLPPESLAQYLIHMIELESREWPFPNFCYGAGGQYAARLAKEGGDTGLTKVKEILATVSREDVSHLKGKEKLFTDRGSFIFSLVSYLEKMGQLEVVPDFLKIRYYIGVCTATASECDIQPLLDIGKPVVSEILSALSSDLMISYGWVSEVLFGITFQHYEDDDELFERDHKAFVDRWQAWWEKNKSKSRIELALDGLEGDSEATRSVSIEFLREIAQEEFGYDLDKSIQQNKQSIAKWKAWYEKNKDK